jgi:hypothetical protein
MLRIYWRDVSLYDLSNLLLVSRHSTMNTKVQVPQAGSILLWLKCIIWGFQGMRRSYAPLDRPDGHRGPSDSSNSMLEHNQHGAPGSGSRPPRSDAEVASRRSAAVPPGFERAVHVVSNMQSAPTTPCHCQ